MGARLRDSLTALSSVVTVPSAQPQSSDRPTMAVLTHLSGADAQG
ncbi:MAG: hypothetical protein AB4042_01110 [Leptolyngbyaceae cyanobacterium]